jgi:hypothetical protein
MPSKKPLTLSKVLEPPHAPPATRDAAEAVSAPRKDYGDAMNLRLPRRTSKLFRRMAVDEGKKLNEMFVEVVEFYAANRPPAPPER